MMQEFSLAAAAAAQPDTVSWLARHGIGRDVIFGPNSSLVGVARIDIAGRYYQPVPEGRAAVIAPVSQCYATGELDPIDLVAFEPSRPDRWYFRTGYGDILGEDSIERAWMLARPLIMHETPLEWIQSGGHGACVLDWSAARFALGNVRKFHVPNRRYGLRLDRALTEPAQPREILYSEASHAA